MFLSILSKALFDNFIHIIRELKEIYHFKKKIIIIIAFIRNLTDKTWFLIF